MATRLSAWLFYLLPANPILVRVVHAMSRRTRHLWMRFGYLAVLLAVVTISLLATRTTACLADLAKGASTTFMLASITQLILMCFLAPIFTAGAITQEKDAQTYNILLSTPLSNAQIVIGSLMSRLYFVLVLLLAGLPIFLTTTVYGGVTIGQIVRSCAIAASTAVLTGSLAIMVSTVRVGTRRTIFSFVLCIAVYLLTVYALGRSKATLVPEAPVSPITERQLSWMAAFHPLLALEVALNRVQAPDVTVVGSYGPLGKYIIAYPPMMYLVMTFVASVLMVLLSMFFVRRGARAGEETLLSRIASRLRLSNADRLTRKPHQVWSNPVAWREAVTRASATSRSVGRYLVIGCGLAGAIVLLVYYARNTAGNVSAAVAREWLANVVAIEFAIALLIATHTAASSLTKEKESKTMDLMLVTPLTSSYIIWGKLRGLISFVVPMILIPVASLLLFGLFDVVRRPAERVVYPETAFEVGCLLVVFASYACLLGLYFSLKQKKTVRAVVLAIGVLLVANLVVFLLWSTIFGSAGVFGEAASAGTPFTAIFLLIDPSGLFDSPAAYARSVGQIRIAALTGTCVFVFVHAAAVYSCYKSMVRSFDMVIRKQSGH